MNETGFNSLLKKLPSLTPRQRGQLLDVMRPAIGFENVCAAIAQVKPMRCCPVCRAERPYRHGLDRGVQRYRCRACRKTFSALSGTPLARLRHRAKWLDYLAKMLETKSVRASAQAVGVHRNTSFRWRHRFLALTKHDRAERLAGIAEADEMFLLESQKGSRTLDRPARRRGGGAATRGITREHVCILVARERTGQTLDFITGRGAVTKHQLLRHLGPRLDSDVLLVTDGHHAYQAFAREAGIAHAFVTLRRGERVRGDVHVQNVHGYHQRFRQWLARFHGVASSYLPNYLGWRWALDGERIASPERLLRAALGVFYS